MCDSFVSILWNEAEHGVPKRRHSPIRLGLDCTSLGSVHLDQILLLALQLRLEVWSGSARTYGPNITRILLPTDYQESISRDSGDIFKAGGWGLDCGVEVLHFTVAPLHVNVNSNLN